MIGSASLLIRAREAHAQIYLPGVDTAAMILLGLFGRRRVCLYAVLYAVLSVVVKAGSRRFGR